MVRYLIRFAYIGTKYKGIQKMKTLPPDETIQGILEVALQELKPSNEFATHTCSRTDKGVHALCNLLHVDLEHRIPGETYQPYRMTEILNMYLRNQQHDIVVTKTCVVPDTFNARYYAKWRSYIYRLALLNPSIKPLSFIPGVYDEYLPICERGRCHVVHGSLNISKILETLKVFRGTHDFTTFSNKVKKEKKNPVKTMSDVEFYHVPVPSSIRDPLYQNVEIWELYIKGNSFLYHQVRKMMGALLSVGYGQLSVEGVKNMLEARSPSKWKCCTMAPAHGLYLSDIQFDSKDFQVQDQDSQSDVQSDSAVHLKTNLG